MKKILFLLAIFTFSSQMNHAQTVTDIDGNVYNTITIGTQVWLKENLRVIHYRNGEAIPMIVNSVSWSGLTTGAFCNYTNSSAIAAEYGRLYNFHAVSDARGVTPEGWHVPTDEDWQTLSDYLGGQAFAGGILKETGTLHWGSTSACATNEFGFTALPGGYRMGGGEYMGLHHIGTWWSATACSASEAWGRGIFSDDCLLDRGSSHLQTMAQSIRCVRDALVGTHDHDLQSLIQVYPNPAAEKIFVKCSDKIPVSLSIYTLTGQTVLQRMLHDGSAEIGLSSLQRGIYILKFFTGEWTGQRKLVLR